MARPAPDPIAVLRGHHAEVQALDFLEAEQALVTGDAEGEVRVWDLQDLRPLTSNRAHPVSGGVVNLQAFSWQGRQFLATQGKDMTFHLWRLEAGLHLPSEPLFSIHKMASNFCRFSLLPPPPDEGSPPATCGTKLSSARGRGNNNSSPACGPGGDEAAGRADRGQCEAQPSLPSISSSAGPATPVTASHDCSATQPDPQRPPALIAIPGDDNASAEIWCWGCGQRLASLAPPAVESPTGSEGRKLGMCTSLRLFRLPGAAAPCLAAGYEAGWVAAWELRFMAADSIESSASRESQEARGGSAVLLAARQLHGEPVLSIDMDAAGVLGASGGADARLALFRLDAAAGALKVKKAVALKAAGVNEVAVRRDGHVAATAGWDRRVRIINCRTGEPLAVLKYHRAAVAAVRFSPRTSLLASGSRDGTVALWSIYRSQGGPDPEHGGAAGGAP